MHRLKRLERPSPSMTVAMLALFVALGGTATAAKVLISSSAQIKSGVIKRSDLAQNVVNSSRVQNGSLGIDDFSRNARGALESGTQAYEAFRADGPNEVAAGESATVATLRDLPPGAYAIFGKTVLTAQAPPDSLLAPGGSVGGHCVLDADGDTDEARTLLGAPYSNSPSELTTQITRTFARTGSAKLVCDVSQVPWKASNTSIIALRVGASPRQSVDG